MKKILYLFIFVVIPVILFAHSPLSEVRLPQNPNVGKSDFQYDALAIRNQEPKEECGTIQALKEIREGIKRPRPPSGPKYINTTNFRIHFDTTGTHATTRAYAESTGAYAETCWARLTRLGWIMPPPDGTNGGDSRYDIYIRDVSPYLGVCYGESPYNTPYPDGYSSWVEVINGGITYSRLRALVVHEIHHGIQFRYSVNEYDGFYDNSSVFIEDIVYDDVNTLPGRLGTAHPNPLTRPQWKITVEDSLYAYRGALWIHFLDEYYEATVPSRAARRMWEMCGSHAGNHSLTDIDSILRINYSSNLLKALGHYAIWRYFTGGRDDGRHYEEGSTYPLGTILRTHSTYPASGTQGTSNPSGPGGNNWITFTNFGNNRLTIYFDGQNGYEWSAYVLGIGTGGISYEYKILLEPTPDTGRITIPGWEYNTVVLIPVVTHWTGTANNLTYSYTATIGGKELANIQGAERNEFGLMIKSSNPSGLPISIYYSFPQMHNNASLEIFDIAGKLLKSYTLHRTIPRNGTLVWNGKDNQEMDVPNGVYFCRLINGSETHQEKITLIR